MTTSNTIPPAPVAIIDIGSGSIKALVATPDRYLYEDLIGTRISTGLGQNNTMVLSPDSIAAGLDSISQLYEQCQVFSPQKTIIVATSAVRDAANQQIFADAIENATGIQPWVLSGDEEAFFIGLGASCDPNLQNHQNFSLFDLGGGSLECLSFSNKQVTFSQSFQLGTVRLTEKFIPNPKLPIPTSQLQQITHFIQSSIGDFPQPNIPLVGMGGGLSNTRKLLNLKDRLPSKSLHELLSKLASLPYEKRIDLGIPPFRADVLPIGIAIILAIADKINAPEIIYSSFNLRYGLVKWFFSQPPSTT